ncbi:MAG TPA: hypothetical protein VMG12_17025 [Polyangiaceae bacterium]|nr:hypothetical protein [Polyangiaceae bacterium]
MTLRCDDHGFTIGAAVLRWDELLAVGIRTTADGPVADDCFWQFLLRAGTCLELPSALLHGDALGALFERLPGADLGKVVAAMGCVEERVFRIWHAEESAWPWDGARLGTRFAALIERLGGDMRRAPEAFERLEAAWSAPQRRYHDREHLLDCLRELDAAPVEHACADIAELALWYHDAIYEPGQRDSEERSAQLLLEATAQLGVRDERARAAARSVRATAHGAGQPPSDPSRDPCVDLVLDVDLAILGRDALRFLEFEYAVAEEYARFPRLQFILARGRFLEGLIAAPIYRTAHFRQRYEARARANLAALLGSQRYRLHRGASRLRRWFVRD